MHQLVIAGGLHQVKVLLDQHPPAVRLMDKQRRSPLHLAAQTGSLDLIEYFLSVGADVNARDQECGTPLHYATKHSAVDIVGILLKRGADPELRDTHNKIPLGYAKRRSMIAWLLEYGCLHDARNSRGETALIHFAALGDVDEVRSCLTTAVDLEKFAKNGRTALHCAAAADHVEVVEALYDAGADIEVKVRTAEELTPLHLALVSDNYRSVEKLLDCGADLETSYKSYTPLGDACRHRCEKAGEGLVRRGANVNQVGDAEFGPALRGLLNPAAVFLSPPY